MGKVLAQGVAYEVVVQEDSALVGVAHEVDAEHVVNFTFLEFRRRIQVADAGGVGKERRGPKFMWKIVDYIKNVRTEMKRVTWPTRPEVGRMSLVVIFALVFFGILIYIVDSAVTPVLYALSGLGG